MGHLKKTETLGWSEFKELVLRILVGPLTYNGIFHNKWRDPRKENLTIIFYAYFCGYFLNKLFNVLMKGLFAYLDSNMKFSALELLLF